MKEWKRSAGVVAMAGTAADVWNTHTTPGSGSAGARGQRGSLHRTIEGEQQRSRDAEQRRLQRAGGRG